MTRCSYRVNVWAVEVVVGSLELRYSPSMLPLSIICPPPLLLFHLILFSLPSCNVFIFLSLFSCAYLPIHSSIHLSHSKSSGRRGSPQQGRGSVSWRDEPGAAECAEAGRWQVHVQGYKRRWDIQEQRRHSQHPV